jgi:hypothetical protein
MAVDSVVENPVGALNVKLRAQLESFIGAGEIDIRFEAPHPDTAPKKPTLYLFNYLLHEDLNVRHGGGRTYEPTAGAFAPESAYVRALYLISYSDAAVGESSSGDADSRTTQVVSQVVSALLSARTNREFKDTVISLPEPAASAAGTSAWQGPAPRGTAVVHLAATFPVQVRAGGQEN